MERSSRERVLQFPEQAKNMRVRCWGCSHVFVAWKGDDQAFLDSGLCSACYLTQRYPILMHRVRFGEMVIVHCVLLLGFVAVLYVAYEVLK